MACQQHFAEAAFAYHFQKLEIARPNSANARNLRHFCFSAAFRKQKAAQFFFFGIIRKTLKLNLAITEGSLNEF